MRNEITSSDEETEGNKYRKFRNRQLFLQTPDIQFVLLILPQTVKINDFIKTEAGKENQLKHQEMKVLFYVNLELTGRAGHRECVELTGRALIAPGSVTLLPLKTPHRIAVQ